MKDTVNQLKQNYETQSKLLNQKLSQTNDEMVKKTNELMQNLHELHEKIRDVEAAPRGQGRQPATGGRSRGDSPERDGGAQPEAGKSWASSNRQEAPGYFEMGDKSES